MKVVIHSCISQGMPSDMFWVDGQVQSRVWFHEQSLKRKSRNSLKFSITGVCSLRSKLQSFKSLGSIILILYD